MVLFLKMFSVPVHFWKCMSQWKYWQNLQKVKTVYTHRWLPYSASQSILVLFLPGWKYVAIERKELLATKETKNWQKKFPRLGATNNKFILRQGKYFSHKTGVAMLWMSVLCHSKNHQQRCWQSSFNIVVTAWQNSLPRCSLQLTRWLKCAEKHLKSINPNPKSTSNYLYRGWGWKKDKVGKGKDRKAWRRPFHWITSFRVWHALARLNQGFRPKGFNLTSI